MNLLWWLTPPKTRDPKGILLAGAKHVEAMLAPHGFTFFVRGEGPSSGGNFAWGEFIRDDRRLELHLRYSLGLVRYHVANHSASHEFYMRELNVRSSCRYPGFSDDPLSAFQDVAHDLALAEDFVRGSAAILIEAAIKEKVYAHDNFVKTQASYAGDDRHLQSLRQAFHEKRYEQVIICARALRYPDQMTESERKMVEIAERNFRK